jgi:hypothetical protein
MFHTQNGQSTGIHNSLKYLIVMFNVFKCFKFYFGNYLLSVVNYHYRTLSRRAYMFLTITLGCILVRLLSTEL